MPALAARLVEEEPGGDADVQRLDAARERDADGVVARAPDERPEAASLGAEDERGASREVGLPYRARRVGRRGEDPERRPLRLRQVAREVRHDGDGKVLDGARRRAADG